MLADDRSAPGSTEAGPGNSPATQDGDKKRGMMQDKPEVFPERGRFERLTICYATVEIGLKKPFSVLHISDTHLTAAYPHENQKKLTLNERRKQGHSEAGRKKPSGTPSPGRNSTWIMSSTPVT
jgi:hypothetical protein